MVTARSKYAKTNIYFGSGLLGLVLVVVVVVLVVLVLVVVSWLYFKGVSSSDCRLRSILQLLSIKMICFEQSVCVRFL